MASIPTATPPAASDRRQLQQIVAGLTEGVILIDAEQSIVWANQAALAMHGVATLAELGTTVDAYRERFSLQYRNNHKLMRGDYPIERVIAGDAFHDVVVEVTPPGAEQPQWTHRVRSLVLTHQSGEPDCLVLILSDVTERFDAEERFESSFNVNPAPAIICRLADGLYIKVNHGFLGLTGFSKREIIGRSFSHLDLLAGSATREAGLVQMSRGEPIPQSEARLQVADGRRKAVIVAGQPIEVSGQACMLFTFIDLDPLRAAQAALRETEQRSRASFEALYTETPVPLHSLDPHGRVVSVSNRWLELFGYERDSVIGKKITSFMTTEAAEHHLARYWPELLEQGFIDDKEYKFVKCCGEIVDILVSARIGRDERGAFVRTMAVLTDVTERKQSEDRFEKAFRLAPVPMLVCSMDRLRILNANDAFLHVTGVAKDALCRSGEVPRWWDGGECEQFLADLRQSGRVRNRDARIVRADGAGLHMVISAEQVGLPGEKCALLVLQDVTERRRSEMQLFEAIEAVMQDTSWFSRSVIDKLAHLRQSQRTPAPVSPLGDLTRRECEILGHVSEGLKDTEIAARLGVSKSTVRNHVAALYMKIGVHSRSDAIVWARERGVAAGHSLAPGSGGKHAISRSG